MESRAKLLGHPIHQMLIVFPLGLLAMAVVFDLLAMGLGNGYWSEIALSLACSPLRLARLTGSPFLPAPAPSELERYTVSATWLSCCCSQSVG